ncbi:MAG: S8 family peptidase [Solirubrobacterales bacterium]|nr:S8 family peptidase [Solirubrobacterales bacterium]
MEPPDNVTPNPPDDLDWYADDSELLEQSTLSDALKDADQRELLRLPPGDEAELDVIIELNLLHEGGLKEAHAQFKKLYEPLRDGEPEEVANTYVACRLSMREIQQLIRSDEKHVEQRKRAIYRVWPDFPVKALIDRSVATVKADAARRSYEATGVDVTWAVIDSGIDANHPHFKHYDTLTGDVESLHHDFTQENSPLTDEYGHGTHVAGIIAGGLAAGPAYVAQRVASEADADGGDAQIGTRLDERPVSDPQRLSGVAPGCKLVSLKVLDKLGTSRSRHILRALQYIREEVNGHGKLLRVQGVNLSVGYEFDAQWFACGQSPLCVEVDRLVKSGVVVVVAAGNTGYGAQSTEAGRAKTGLTLTINDPGNAALAITVGATHRDSPHTYGVSYFSSKGPTGDGRLKPDLVAPGERITSCAAGRRLGPVQKLFEGRHPTQDPHPCLYIDESGTSMAAPHVSGAIAAFLSIRREFIGRPEEVKRIFLENATSLGRERYFEGHGMLDLMRVIQAV